VIVPATATGDAVLAWIGLVLGLVIALVVLGLLQSLLRSALEIHRYGDDILDAGLAISTNLNAVDELARTQQLATAVPGLAVAYLHKLEADG
jgi:hypothetical protein